MENYYFWYNTNTTTDIRCINDRCYCVLLLELKLICIQYYEVNQKQDWRVTVLWLKNSNSKNETLNVGSFTPKCFQILKVWKLLSALISLVVNILWLNILKSRNCIDTTALLSKLGGVFITSLLNYNLSLLSVCPFQTWLNKKHNTDNVPRRHLHFRHWNGISHIIRSSALQ